VCVGIDRPPPERSAASDWANTDQGSGECHVRSAHLVTSHSWACKKAHVLPAQTCGPTAATEEG
jgi:hypothetical protein